jgi:hypothetical protein
MDFDGIILITTCTSRKRKQVPPSLQASSLREGSQRSVLNEWCHRLSANAAFDTASAIYCGRAFREAFLATREVSGDLWIISAGIGLVSEKAMIPSYSITIGDSGSDSILRKIKGEKFSPAKWWAGITAFHGSPNPMCRLIIHNPSKLFVIALSQAYAGLVQQDILSLSDHDLHRVRLIGLALHPVVDSRLQKVVMPYDERLDGPGGTNSGTRSDFAQRAMRHFVTEVLTPSNFNDLQLQIQFVSKTLSCRNYRQVPKRKRVSDQAIMDLILKNWHSFSPCSSSRMLRMIRDDEKIACEQSRFKELYRLAKEIKEKVSP